MKEYQVTVFTEYGEEIDNFDVEVLNQNDLNELTSDLGARELAERIQAIIQQDIDETGWEEQ